MNDFREVASISSPIGSKANDILQVRSGWSFECRKRGPGRWEVCVLGLAVPWTLCGGRPEVGGLSVGQ